MNRRTLLKSIAGAALACVWPWKIRAGIARLDVPDPDTREGQKELAKHWDYRSHDLSLQMKRHIAQAREMDSIEALNRSYYEGLHWTRTGKIDANRLRGESHL